jgi:hypothetical protein
MERQDSLLADYRYMKTVVTEHLDGSMSVKKREERLVEVTSVPRGPDVEMPVTVDETVSRRKEKERAGQRQSGAVEQSELGGPDFAV